MATIGAAWLKNKDNGEFYYSCNIDEALLPLTLTKEKRLILVENKNKGDNEKAPDFKIELYVPKEKEEK
jgi:uncharacterized protein (DUF736 family)